MKSDLMNWLVDESHEQLKKRRVINDNLNGLFD